MTVTLREIRVAISNWKTGEWLDMDEIRRCVEQICFLSKEDWKLTKRKEIHWHHQIRNALQGWKGKMMSDGSPKLIWDEENSLYRISTNFPAIEDKGFGQISALIRKILNSDEIMNKVNSLEEIAVVRNRSADEVANEYGVERSTVNDKIARINLGLYEKREEFDRKLRESILSPLPTGLWVDLQREYTSTEERIALESIFTSFHDSDDRIEHLGRPLEDGFDVKSLDDEEAEYEMRRGKKRLGQQTFKDDLIDAYSARCMLTGTECERVIDACHIYDSKGPKTMIVTNGLLLRCDIHRLWDSKKKEALIRIHPVSLELEIVDRSLPKEYLDLEGKKLDIRGKISPNTSYLEWKYLRHGGIL